MEAVELGRIFAHAKRGGETGTPRPDKAIEIRDDVGFFQAVRAALAKSTLGKEKTEEDLDHAIRQLLRADAVH